MNDLSQVTVPTEAELVVAFFDLSRFMRAFSRFTLQTAYAFMDEYYTFAGGLIERRGGLVVKFIGDAGLVVFPAAQASVAVRGLLDLQAEGDAWLLQRAVESKHVVKAHVGLVMCGPLGAPSARRFDVIGETVNQAAVMPSQGFAISPQLFRRLDDPTRKLFKKHTPPITYIPLDEPHTR